MRFVRAWARAAPRPQRLGRGRRVRPRPPARRDARAATRSCRHDDAVPPAARIPRRSEAPVSEPLDRGGTAEVQVAPSPPDELVAESLEPIELCLVAAP